MHWLYRHRVIILAGICVVCTAGILLVRLVPSVPFFSTVWSSEQAFQDLMIREGRKTATKPDFVFVGIDQGTLELPPPTREELANNRAFQLMTERPFPWSREVWALLLDRLFQAGARVVMFDLVCNPPNDGDPAFHAALDRYRDKVVLGANFDFSETTQSGGGFAQAVVPNPSLIPPPQIKDDRVGYVTFFADRLDQKIRAARYTMTDMQLAQMPPRPDEFANESLSARGLEKMGRGADVPRDLNAHLIRFSALDAYRPLPLYQLFDAKFWHQNYADGTFFKDKIILIGPSAQVTHDVVDTPLSPETPGPTMHLHAMAAALDHEFLSNTTLTTDYALVCIAGVLAWVVVAFVRRPLLSILIMVVIGAAYLGMVRLFYDRVGLFVHTVPIMATFLISGAFSLGFEYALERIEKLRTRRTLERYVSKNLVKEILENPDSYYHSLLGVRVPATVLFSDLVGFTTLSEKADPEALVKQLNEYLTQMTTVVFENGGTLDKFIGDAIMCVWGNVKSFGVAEDARHAVRTALGMRRALEKLNQGWRADGRMGLGMGVGINQGEVIVGNIGSHERMDPTVIGDSVNLASRLEGLTRIYGVDILIGPTATEFVRDEFHLKSVARVQVKGKSEPVDVSTLIGSRNEEVDPELVKWLEAYEEGILKFRERDFNQAKILFSRFLEFYPDDFLAKTYLERALEYEQQPPDEAWNAVEVFKKK
ncbi:MAG TPA: adenylate/guanylate cyclase domain-containing protein [Chthoniobacterales bacterium]|nr:adenylate/guanylate cyclase domain-containing protein [Chthoniobacterales bacterium]